MLYIKYLFHAKATSFDMLPLLLFLGQCRQLLYFSQGMIFLCMSQRVLFAHFMRIDKLGLWIFDM